MFKKLSLFFAAFILLATTQSHAANNSGVDLKWNFTKGETFNLKYKVNLNSFAEIPYQLLLPPGPQQPTGVTGPDAIEKAVADADLMFLFKVTVMEVDADGNADLQLAMQAADVSARAKLGEQEFKYEADLFEPVMTPEGARSMLNPDDSINIWKVDPRGQIIAINGQSIDATISQLELELQKNGIQVNADELRQFTDMFFYFVAAYPDKSLNVGQTWAYDADLSNLLESGSSHDEVTVNSFQFLFQQNWLLKNNSGNSVVLEGKSNAMPKFEASLDGPEAAVNVNVSGTEQIEVVVDKKSGIANSRKQQLNINGKFRAIEKNEAAQELNVPFTVKVTSDVTLSK